MPTFRLGCNFDPALIEGVAGLNARFSSRPLTEFYGSIRSHAEWTARPAFRLPDISELTLRRYVQACRRENIDFNYTLNTVHPGSKRALWAKRKELAALVQRLEDFGIRNVTITHPLVGEIVREASRSLDIEISTIAHVDTVSQILAWKQAVGATGICGSLSKNRSMLFLSRAARVCAEHGIRLNLMVNEFCSSGGMVQGRGFGTNCIYRASCYLCHAEDVTREDAQLFEKFPMGRCISGRDGTAAWLKTRFIRPEDIGKYEDIGISHFKITGRTGSTLYLLSTATAYMQGSFGGNLLELWKPLETIVGEVQQDTSAGGLRINNRMLDGFIDHWVQNPQHECANELCGDTCSYCDEFASGIS